MQLAKRKRWYSVERHVLRAILSEPAEYENTERANSNRREHKNGAK